MPVIHGSSTAGSGVVPMWQSWHHRGLSNLKAKLSLSQSLDDALALSLQGLKKKPKHILEGGFNEGKGKGAHVGLTVAMSSTGSFTPWGRPGARATARMVSKVTAVLTQLADMQWSLPIGT